MIGGGVIGCSVAYHLAHMGWRDVVLLERDRLTSGTTWHAAGLIVTFGSMSETSTEMRKYSRDLYERLEAETGQATGFKPVGFVELAADADRLEEFRRVAAFNRYCGVDVQEISPSDVKRLFPLARTELSEFYAVPKDGIGVRGGDIDKNGVLWGSGSNGSLISFDRSKCKSPLSGPNATGNHCPEGFAYHNYPGPGFEGFEKNSAEASYYTWVDHHNTLGLGENVPISTANLQDGFAALKDGRMILMRVPYPMGFFAKGLDGRIDDPNAGWKGRGLWSTNGDRTPWLMEGGKGSKPRVVQIQVRPDPLAK